MIDFTAEPPQNERSKWSYECQIFNHPSGSWHQDYMLHREEFPIANKWFRHRTKCPLPPKWQKQFFRVVAHCHVADGYYHHCTPEKCRVIFAAYDGRVFLSVQPLRDQPIHNIDSEWWRL